VVDQRYAGMQARLHQSVVDLIYSNYINLLSSKTTPKLVKAEIFYALENDKKALLKKSSKSSDGYSSFYSYQIKRLESIEPNASGDQITLPTMPPGSPI
jgi:hypothetical protein